MKDANLASRHAHEALMFVSDHDFSAAKREKARLRALDEYAVFDTPPDVDLDRLVELAARMYAAPVAALSLVGKDRLFFKSRFGMEATGIGREGAFCSYAIESDGLFLVADARKDERFAAHPLVKKPPKIRFYAGIPLTAPSGQKIGTLCILDIKPRPNFSDDDRKNLEDVAALVMNRLELRRLDEAKQGGHSRFERIASTSPDAIIGADSSGCINYWNAAAESLFGHSAQEAMGEPIGLIFPQRVTKLQTAELMSLVNCGSSNPPAQQVGLVAQRRDGSEFAAELSLSVWRENDNVSFAATLRDISEREQGEKRLFGLALLDPVTGLPNRAFLINRLQEAVATEAGTLLLIDLLGFKDLNDRLGHVMADLVLSESAERLRAHVGAETTIARVGADEFALFLPRVADPTRASRHADEVMQLFAAPFAVSEESIHVGANLGVAICPAHGTRAEELLANADLALQSAKSVLGSGYRLFKPSLRRAVIARRTYEAELKRALETSQFELFYQPQVRLADRKLVGAEALLRWRHPQRGLLTPADFLAVLESAPLAAPVGDWVLETACAQAAVWRRLGLPDFRMSVNLFGAQFNSGDLPTRVEQALLQNGLPASALELEVTENIMLRHDESIIVPLREMCAWGVGIAFDDYGTGFASLSLLKRYPVTRLKIDKSFVRDLCTDAEDAAIIQAIMYLGRRLGLGIIAEGIETEAQEEALRLYGCTEAQGYFYGRPMPALSFSDFLREDRERTVA
jgi:diguanylate cyclase (GGDEF)-like protein/PAS domain S-box-containing protein